MFRIVRTEPSLYQSSGHMTKYAIDVGFTSDGPHPQVRPKCAHKEIPNLTFCNKQAQVITGQ
jgi:hypothetical protein